MSNINIVPKFEHTTLDSPFDSIRHYDEKALEFWKGRELQKLLGYKTWENFDKSIRRAIVFLQK